MSGTRKDYYKDLSCRQKRRRLLQEQQKPLSYSKKASCFTRYGEIVEQEKTHQQQQHQSISNIIASENAMSFSSSTSAEPNLRNHHENDASQTYYFDFPIADEKYDGKTFKLENFCSKLQRWVTDFNISHAALSNLLRILKLSTEFSSLPSDARSFMKTPRNASQQIISGNGGDAIYFGFKKALERSIIDHYDVLPDQVKVNLNIDGLPLCKSSGSQFWPILGAIYESFSTTPFIICIYHGMHKPINSNIFLRQFVDETQEVLKYGLSIRNKLINVFINAIICDAPARAFVSGIKNHTGYFGCGKCRQEGEFIDNRVVFLETNSELRSDASFRNRSQPEHHKYDSVLENLGIGMVSQLPLDYMHLICLGVVKRLIQFWVKGALDVRLKSSDLKKATDHLLSLKINIPDEFSRLPRCLEDVDRWKATEFRQFLLYTGPIVLKNKLPSVYYKHFSVLSIAVRILADKKLCVVMNNFAQSLLIWFVENYTKLYGQKYMTYNVHNLIHICQDVLLLGPLDGFSAFKFENYMQIIKNKVKNSSKPLHQITNRLSEMYRLSLTKPVSNNILIPKISIVKKYIDFCAFKLTIKERDKYFEDQSGKIYEIVDILDRNGISCVQAREMKRSTSFYSEPINSKQLGIHVVNLNASDCYGENQELTPSEIKRKCLKFNFAENMDVIIPLIHH